MKRLIGVCLVLPMLFSAAFLGLSGRWRELETHLRQDVHALRHPANALVESQPLADPLLLGSVGNAQASATRAVPIYDAGVLSAGWQDWSWTNHTLNAWHGDAGAGALSVSYGAWAGLYFHANQPVDAWTGTVNLLLDGGTLGGQDLAMTLLDSNGAWGKHVALSQYLPHGNLPASQWVSISIPLSGSLALGTPVSGVVLQENSGKAQPAMYVARIALNVSSLTSVPAGHAPIALQVNAQANQHSISPYIYGMADDDGPAYDQQVRPTLIRWGGNPNSRYNWQLGNAWNTASDYFYENTDYGSPSGSAADGAIAHSNAIGAAEWLTIPTLGWVAKDTSSFSFPGPDGKPTNGQGSSCTDRQLTADPTRTSIKVGPPFMQDWVRHLQKSDLKVRFYSMDNEPELWGVTHYDVHPTCTSYDEIYNEFTTYASAIKAVDPTSMITGPATCCWYYYWNSMAGKSDKAKHGNMDFLPWFLGAVRRHDTQTHQRTLDVLDVHYYPEGFYNNMTDAVTSAWRLLETRSLWDPTYSDHSWIGQPVQLIPRMQALIAKQYPGTRLSIGEWNFGADTSINGGLAIADVLGIFGQQGLYMAAYWRYPPSGSPGAMAYQMYRNYDGHGASFGDTSVSTSSSNRNRVAIYASLRRRDGHLITVLIDKMPTTEAVATMQITGFRSARTSLYRYDATSPTTIQHAGRIALGAQAVITLPPYSITVLDSTPVAGR